MTALQKLIEILNESQKFINDDDSKEDKYYRTGLKEAIEVAKNLIPTEKQQIIEAYNHGCLDTLKDEMKQGKQYYNETYKK